jgi:hypothetical protein
MRQFYSALLCFLCTVSLAPCERRHMAPYPERPIAAHTKEIDTAHDTLVNFQFFAILQLQGEIGVFGRLVEPALVRQVALM